MSVEAAQTFRPAGLVTLLTDFGQQDIYVGVMHGVLHRLAPGLRAVVDLTHEIAPQDVEAAAFQLTHAWSWFPAGTVHAIVVDPGVGSERGILLALAEGHAFLAPDNGLLEAVLPGVDELRRLDPERVAVGPISNTFHGRDLFAPAAAALAEGVEPAELAPELVEFAPRCPTLSGPAVGADPPARIEGRIVAVDRFGNLISDIPAVALGLQPDEAPGPEWRVHIGALELPLSRTYATVDAGAPLALIDSFGRVEVAVREGDAATSLGLGRGAALTLHRGP